MQYFISSLVNYIMIPLIEWKPSLQQYLAPVSLMTFASFALNDPDQYYKGSDHLALLTGYVSICYLTSQFLNVDWLYTLFGELFITVTSIYYFTVGLGYRPEKIIFGMTMTVIVCGLNTYFN